jgi:hypothetical protein
MTNNNNNNNKDQYYIKPPTFNRDKIEYWKDIIEIFFLVYDVDWWHENIWQFSVYLGLFYLIFSSFNKLQDRVETTKNCHIFFVQQQLKE